jgi:hypothetical protein
MKSAGADFIFGNKFYPFQKDKFLLFCPSEKDKCVPLLRGCLIGRSERMIGQPWTGPAATAEPDAMTKKELYKKFS